MFTIKNIYRYICLAHLVLCVGVFTACTNEEEVPVHEDKGNHPVVMTSRVAIADNANIETARVLVFGSDGNLVSNSGVITVTDGMVAGNILTVSSGNILADTGTNHVYVVLNEETGNLSVSLESVQTKEAMEILRSTPVDYPGLISADGEKEPAFLMCVYDEVNVTSETTSLDITGLDEDDYGFSMKRTMAKVVLEQIVGGVGADGTIVGTESTWDEVKNVDQIPGDTENKDLIATSELFVQKVELINVPISYSWKQEKGSEGEAYTKDFHEGMSLTNDLEPIPSGFLQRVWPGKISASGTVGFDRTDYIEGIWLQEANSGTNSYGFTPVYFDITENQGGVKSFYEKHPDGSVDLNDGNFETWLALNYGTEGAIVPGDIEPKDLELNNITIDPAPWYIDAGKAYYIPENITENEERYTKLRVYYKIADVAAHISDDKVLAAIQASVGAGDFDIVQTDGTNIDFSTDEGLTYFYSLGHWVSKSGNDDDNMKGYAWTGFSIRVSGENVQITGEGNGYYHASGDNVGYIDVPLNNDMVEENVDTDTDHNIYRGREYRVKLYITKKNSDSWSRSASSASRTVQIGGEEFCITGKVVATPMK